MINFKTIRYKNFLSSGNTFTEIDLDNDKTTLVVGHNGAGKSTMGKAAMGYTQPGCKIISGKVFFDGIDLTKISETEKRKMWGTKISYVAQSAAASFNPAHRLMGQTISAANRAKLNSEDMLKKDAIELYPFLRDVYEQNRAKLIRE